jgi:hypothetical protein
MLNLKKLLHKPNLFARIFGIKLDKFLILVERMQKVWTKSEAERLSNKERKRSIGAGRKYTLETMEEKVLLVLMFYRHNTTHELLGLFWNLDASNVTRLINKMLPIFEQAADPELKTYFKKAKEDSKKISNPIEFFEKYPDLRSLKVDATEQRRNRPKDYELRKKIYSGKKKIFANKTQILIDEKLKILDVSKSYSGSIHDKKIFDLEGTAKKIPSKSILLGDLGYLGAPKEHPDIKIMLPHKKLRGQQKLSAEQKEFNRLHSKERVPVEHAIGRVKVFKICSNIYRGKEKKYNQIFRNVAALVNLNYCST